MVLPIIAAIAGGAVTGAIGAAGARSAARSQEKAAEKQVELSREQFERMDQLQRELYLGQRADNRRDFDRQLRVATNTRDQAQGVGNWLYGMNVDHSRRTTANNMRDLHGGHATTRAAIANANNRNIADLREGRAEGIGYFRPAYDAGQNALAAYQYNLGLGDAPAGYSGIELSPGAKFLLEEGRKEVEGGAAGGGGLYSGNTLAELERLRTGTVATDRDNQMAQLFSLLGIGQNAAGSMASIGQNYDNAITGQRNTGMAARNAAEAYYTPAIAAERTAGQQRGYAYGADRANALTNALNNYAGAASGASSAYTANQGTARANRANLAGQASQAYQNAAHDAYSSMGNAGAAGAIGTANAFTGGINNALAIYGMMGGNWGNPGQPNAGTNLLARSYGNNTLPALY